MTPDQYDQYDHASARARRATVRHVFALLAVIAAIWAIVLLGAGCAAMDKVAEQGAELANDPTVKEIAGSIPFGEMIVGLIGAGCTLYTFIRGRRWKSAFTTVVQTVDPFIPSDEPARDRLKAFQGEQVTRLVKSVKTSPS